MSEQGSATPGNRVESTHTDAVKSEPENTEPSQTEPPGEEPSNGESTLTPPIDALDENSGIEHAVENQVDPKADEFLTGATIPRISRQIWLMVGLLAVVGAFAAGLWQTRDNDSIHAESNGEPQVVFIDSTPTVVPTLEFVLPTPTPTPETPLATATTDPRDMNESAVALAPLDNLPGDLADDLTSDFTEGMTEVVASDLPTLAIVLPTLTPTPEPPPVDPRSVEIAGQANLRMQMANPDFQSSGHPIQRPIAPRTYRLDGETTRVEDQWCIQMGLVNLDVNLEFELNPATSAVNATGTADLYNDFCENRGGLTDSTPISLTIPADARSQSSYNLFAERQLLNLSGLLDMDTGVIIELNIANLRPRPE